MFCEAFPEEILDFISRLCSDEFCEAFPVDTELQPDNTAKIEKIDTITENFFIVSPFCHNPTQYHPRTYTLILRMILMCFYTKSQSIFSAAIFRGEKGETADNTTDDDQTTNDKCECTITIILSQPFRDVPKVLLSVQLLPKVPLFPRCFPVLPL